VIGAVGFVDDVKLVAESRGSMIKLIKEVEEWCKVAGMKLAARKCGYASRGEKENGLGREKIEIGGEEVKCFGERESKRVLGIWVNLELTWEEQEKIARRRVDEIMNQLEGRCFTVKQKVEVVNKLVMPGLEYRMAVVKFSDKSIKKMEDRVTEGIKRALEQCLWKEEALRGSRP
jgi:hypothetical protein